MNIFGFIKRRPILTYYILTFAISWGAIVAAAGPGGFPAKPAQITKMLPVLIAAMLGGPGIASVLLTGIVGGRAGYRIYYPGCFGGVLESTGTPQHSSSPRCY